MEHLSFDFEVHDFSPDQPRDGDGKWTATGAVENAMLEAARAGSRTPPAVEAKEPRWPEGESGGKAGGFSASGRKNTAIGDQAEWLLEQSGMFRSALGDKRQGAFDVQWDHSNMKFEVKAVSVASTQYKVKWKAAEFERKQAAAIREKARPGTMIVVMDHAKGTADVYWRKGLGAWELNKGNFERDWNYGGRIRMPSKMRTDPTFNPKAARIAAEKAAKREEERAAKLAEREARKAARSTLDAAGPQEWHYDPDQPRDEQGRFAGAHGGPYEDKMEKPHPRDYPEDGTGYSTTRIDGKTYIVNGQYHSALDAWSRTQPGHLELARGPKINGKHQIGVVEYGNRHPDGTFDFEIRRYSTGDVIAKGTTSKHDSIPLPGWKRQRTLQKDYDALTQRARENPAYLPIKEPEGWRDKWRERAKAAKP